VAAWSPAGSLRLCLAVLAALGAFLLSESATRAAVPTLAWEPCAEIFECATATVPLDHARPNGRQTQLAVTRLPAQDQENRIGSLFVNFGGPGGDAVGALHAFGAFLFAELNQRFDIVGFDPRGTGQSSNAIDCHVNQETEGLYAQPFTTPYNLDLGQWRARARGYAEACLRENSRALLRFASTADVARDMDLLRAAVGDAKLSYLGFSYGTFLGATYASLFPNNYRALVLDGALDPNAYINYPTESLRAQSAGYERGLDRFFEACAADQAACLGFGGGDPHAAFDALVARADAHPIPAGGEDPRPVDGEDVLAAAVITIYSKFNWPFLAQALAEAENGDGTTVRLLADFFYAWRPDGTYDPVGDRYFVLGAVEQRYTSNPRFYLRAGEQSYSMFDHTWWNTGYVELPYGMFSVDARRAFHGPFRTRPNAPTTLVIGTTYDPATPYRGALAMVDQLRNARLLTMVGDGHTAYGGLSPCIDVAVNAYLVDGTLPAPGTICLQDVPFAQPEPVSAKRLKALAARSFRANPRFAFYGH
jgi:pimeloyl-ACP methyl ester carboxylesterase